MQERSGYWVVTENGTYIADVSDVKNQAGELVFDSAEGNANLIAAAPDLLAACEWLLNPDHPIGSDPELIRKASERARAAIAKAKGEMV
jgi:hypothetical protein